MKGVKQRKGSAISYSTRKSKPNRTKITYYKKPKSKKRIRLMRKKTAPILRYVGENKASFSRYTFFTLLLLFTCALGLSLSFALVTDKKNEIATLQAQLKKQEETNNLLTSEIAQKYDINEIRTIATTRLGMSEPRAHQIIHIHVPRPSFVMQQHGNELYTKQNVSLISIILDFFQR